MVFTTVLLDAGGVIIDESEHESQISNIIVEVLKSEIPDYSQARYQTDVEEAIVSFAPKVYKFILWKNLRPNVSLYEKLYGLAREKWNTEMPPLKISEGLGEELSKISQDYRIGIAGQYGRTLLKTLEDESLLGYFRYQFTQDDFSITKPDPNYYKQICEAIGVDTKECIMVGDRIDNDIIPAKQLGMATVLVRVGLHRNQQPRLPSEQPDIELESISGLAAAISKLGE
jgi:putative hydrolase of the HAD superfamily